jgi:hypothetical protein
MQSLNANVPWYISGLAFECTGCGNCCAGPEEGYVWITPQEMEKVAKLLKMPVQAFRAKYVRQVGRRYSLIEVGGSNDCIFLTPPDAEGNRGCRIYSARPRQCRTWPFWASNLRSPEAWSMAQLRCPGINRGPLHGREKIDADAYATQE